MLSHSPTLTLSQNINQDWGFGGEPLLWTLWGFWWLDSAVSYLIAFGMLYAMYVTTLFYKLLLDR